MNEMALEYRRDIGDYVSALSRRKLPMIATASVLLTIAILVALLMPPVYRSTATILIEEQEIPQDLVRTTITSYADQRIQVISQQVMTRANLMQIVDKYDLYASQRRRETVEEILERMRKDIKLDLVTSDVTDRRGGGKTTATIAFTLSYDSVSAEKSQKVANELTSLYLNENLQIRKQKAEETSSFLAVEAERLRGHIGEIEQRLANFKLRNQGRLPELAQVNMQMRDRAEIELSDLDRQAASIEERRFYLQSQLDQMKPNSPIMSSGGERILDPEDRLRSLRAQYAGLEGLYSQEHPDMIRMRKQMAALERETGLPQDSSEEAKQLAKLKAELATGRDRYSDDHPDVAKIKAAIAALEASIASKPAAPAVAPRKPENPAYLTLQAQLEGLDTEARSLKKHKEELRTRIAMLDSRIERTPEVEKDYLELARDRENSVNRYREIRGKLMEAEVAQDLERDRKSERFSLIDPPQFPEKPRSPNRPAIFLIGILLAVGGGVASVGLLETLDHSVRNSKDLARTISAPLLSVVPYILTQADMQKKEIPWRKIAVVALVIVVGGAVAVHFLWMPLEVIWFSVLRRIGIS
jgi:succinoglycan biosynthesis transport protein ExoP